MNYIRWLYSSLLRNLTCLESEMASHPTPREFLESQLAAELTTWNNYTTDFWEILPAQKTRWHRIRRTHCALRICRTNQRACPNSGQSHSPHNSCCHRRKFRINLQVAARRTGCFARKCRRNLRRRALGSGIFLFQIYTTNSQSSAAHRIYYVKQIQRRLLRFTTIERVTFWFHIWHIFKSQLHAKCTMKLI